jgi:hypothetical protein
LYCCPVLPCLKKFRATSHGNKESRARHPFLNKQKAPKRKKEPYFL